MFSRGDVEETNSLSTGFNSRNLAYLSIFRPFLVNSMIKVSINAKKIEIWPNLTPFQILNNKWNIILDFPISEVCRGPHSWSDGFNCLQFYKYVPFSAVYGQFSSASLNHSNVCPRSSDPFYIVIYNIKLVATSWTYSTSEVTWRKPFLARLSNEITGRPFAVMVGSCTSRCSGGKSSVKT